jgi:dihydrofolate reductase
MKTILVAAMTANGYIAEEEAQSSLDWTSKEDTKFFIEKTKEVGVLIMGRRTYETIGRPLPGRLMIVMSRTPADFPSQPGVLEFTTAEPTEILRKLEERGYGQVVIAGGASVYSAFLSLGLVDELYLTVEPVLFGKGVPFAKDFARVNLELLDAKPLGSRAVLLHYKKI